MHWARDWYSRNGGLTAKKLQVRRLLEARKI